MPVSESEEEDCRSQLGLVFEDAFSCALGHVRMDELGTCPHAAYNKLLVEGFTMLERIETDIQPDTQHFCALFEHDDVSLLVYFSIPMTQNGKVRQMEIIFLDEEMLAVTVVGDTTTKSFSITGERHSYNQEKLDELVQKVTEGSVRLAQKN